MLPAFAIGVDRGRLLLMYRAGKKKERKTEGMGHSAQRVAEEYELFKGSCLTYCKSRTVLTKKGITERERRQLKTLKVTPRPCHRDPMASIT